MAQKIRSTTDKRVVRTKRAIRNAFTELLAEKDLNYITVKDISDRANINRKTFYNYYNGIYQVIEEIESDLVNKFELTFADVSFADCLSDPRIIFDKIDALINTDLDFYGNLFTMDENLNLITKITSLIKAKTKQAICAETGLAEEISDVALEFLISGMIAVYQMWFRSDRTRPLSESSDIVGIICFDGLKGIMRHPPKKSFHI